MFQQELIQEIETFFGNSPNLNRIAIQFSDKYIPIAVEIVSWFSSNYPFKFFFIISDTSFNDCCVDFISASHLEAEAIIHFGPYCSKKYNIPICFLPDFQYHNELNHQVLALIHRFIKSIRSKNILFVIDQVKIDTEIFKVMGAENESCLYFASSEKIESCDKVTKLFNFYLPLDLNEFKDTALIYIGPHEKLAVDFGCIFFNFESLCIDSKNNLCFNASISRELAKRSKLIDSISCFDHVGILVENPNVKLHVDTAQYIQNMCASNDIIADIIYVGRLNEMKIGNFPDIEFFIHLSCSGRSSFSFIKPIVSPLEFICAKFNLDFWNNQHLRDFESFLAFCDSNKEIFLKNYSEDIDLNGKLVIKSFHELSTQLLSTRKNYSYTGLQISPSFQEMRLHKGANGNSTYYDYESN